MRISDWSSDVCSSDLVVRNAQFLQHDVDLVAVRRRPGIELDGHAQSPLRGWNRNGSGVAGSGARPSLGDMRASPAHCKAAGGLAAQYGVTAAILSGRRDA